MGNADVQGGNPNQPEPQLKRIEVTVYTTSGAFPGQGHKQEKLSDIVGDLLEKAAKALGLADTTNWVATVDGQEIDPLKSFAENGLTETATIHWGPREGGGGC